MGKNTKLLLAVCTVTLVGQVP